MSDTNNEITEPLINNIVPELVEGANVDYTSTVTLPKVGKVVVKDADARSKLAEVITSTNKTIEEVIKLQGSTEQLYAQDKVLANAAVELRDGQVALAEAVTAILDNQSTAGSAAGNVPLIGTDLGTTDNNIIVTDANGQLKPSGITSTSLQSITHYMTPVTGTLDEDTGVLSISLPGVSLVEGMIISVMFTNPPVIDKALTVRFNDDADTKSVYMHGAQVNFKVWFNDRRGNARIISNGENCSILLYFTGHEFYIKPLNDNISIRVSASSGRSDFITICHLGSSSILSDHGIGEGSHMIPDVNIYGVGTLRISNGTIGLAHISGDEVIVYDSAGYDWSASITAPECDWGF